MLHPRLRLRHLDCFLETARLGSLSAAADALKISQPAASKTIHELEDILGTPLFDRSGRRLVVSPAGRLFQQSAGAALGELMRAQTLLQGGAADNRKIAAGVLPTAATELFPDAAEAFRKRHPACTLRVTTGPNWLLLSQLREGALDIVVGRMPPSGAGEGLSFRQLYWERVVPVIRPGHPLRARAWEPDDFLRFPLMLPPSGAVIHASVRAFLQSLGLGMPVPAYENVSHAFGRRVVETSDTIWFISGGVVARELAAGTLTVLPVRNELLGGPVGISLKENATRAPELDTLIDALASVATRDPLRGPS
ncbi:LysR substrate-binding domain-containing protein [Martelella limonii]|uniref:LysR substrate-binding domain-containing protein n=1 Tax=Martelella limonii TaxID=1647649 RepID=UPI0015811F21|nr:LysR substrate-binding domain-containing protein [Martelella limonii]